MNIELTEKQAKEVIDERIARKVYDKISSVTFFSVLRYIEKHHDTLVNEIAESALKMYRESQDFIDDLEYMEERRRLSE